jgi:hypothetical protein
MTSNASALSSRDLGQPIHDKELIVCLMNGLRVPEYMPERNFVVHNLQGGFEMACSLCKKTTIQDTIVAGVARSTPLAAFYVGPLALRSSLARHKHHADGPPVVSETPSAPSCLTVALNKLTESISAMQTQMTLKVTINKAFEDKLAKLISQVDRDRNRGKHTKISGPRPPTTICTYCNRPSHAIDN